jgi:2-phospho-L-lactate guanylyltransferase
VAEAERQGLRAVVVRRPGTAADLDTIDDWTDLPAGVRARVRDAVGPALP